MASGRVWETTCLSIRMLILPLSPHLTYWTLAESGGRVLLIGLLSKFAATCIGVWELPRTTLLWKEVDRMPNVPCLEFYGKSHMDELYWKPGIAYVVPDMEAVADVGQLLCCDGGWGKVEDQVLPCNGRKRAGRHFVLALLL
ncbi:putative F-box only protein 6 [Iris pallida]|uniref:F-box only protein 6 n=1 Tax=Iris pallida TaxID=29817 RepID=A0AAX6ELI1_IRIPA|nr:putative F-box only protein 6 [Iris pallida]